MWKCPLGPPAFEQNNHHAEKVQVGVPFYDVLGDNASQWHDAPHWGIVQPEEGLKVEDQEGTCQGGGACGENWELGGIHV